MKKEESKKEFGEKIEVQKERLEKLVQENLSIIYHLVTTDVRSIFHNENFTLYAGYGLYNVVEPVIDKEVKILTNESIYDELYIKNTARFRKCLSKLALLSRINKYIPERKDFDKYTRNIKVNKVLSNTLKNIDSISRIYKDKIDGNIKQIDEFFEQLTITIILDMEKEELGNARSLLNEIFLDNIECENRGTYNEE